MRNHIQSDNGIETRKPHWPIILTVAIDGIMAD